MTPEHLASAAKDELDLVLSFFGRVDTRASVVLAIDTGMLALLSTNAPTWKDLSWWSLIALVPVLLIAASLFCLYKTAFPKLEGGNNSLVYFREIAKRAEHQFIAEFTEQQDDAYVKELLAQTWINSIILKEKFDYLKRSYIFLTLAIVPWIGVLIFFAIQHGQSRMFK